ncbi:MAG: hypothetical protein Q8O89_04285 [Nanoarchaeota archaeon]|nr:hypothetical protein [Nanoarchaeota archaeon]
MTEEKINEKEKNCFDVANENNLNLVSLHKLGIDAILNPRKESAWFGVSCAYPFFRSKGKTSAIEDYLENYILKKQLPDYVRFAEKYLKSFMISVADNPFQYSLMAFGGFDESSAKKKALEIGNYFNKKITQIAKSETIDVFVANDSEIEECLKPSLDFIRDYARTDEHFRNHCKRLTISATNNKLKKIAKEGSEQYNEAFENALKYAIDDIGVYMFMYQDHPISVSKYEQLPIIKDISENKFPKINEFFGIQKIGHIQLVPKGERVFREPYDDEYETISGSKGGSDGKK